MSQPAALDGLDAAVERALALVGSGRTVLGIAGAPGAGKSTLAEALLDRLRKQPPAGADGSWVAHVPMDGFHLADVQLARLGLLDRKGAPETFDVDGYAATLARLHDEPDRTVYAPGFERTLEQPISAALAVTPGRTPRRHGGQLPPCSTPGAGSGCGSCSTRSGSWSLRPAGSSDSSNGTSASARLPTRLGPGSSGSTRRTRCSSRPPGPLRTSSSGPRRAR